MGAARLQSSQVIFAGSHAHRAGTGGHGHLDVQGRISYHDRRHRLERTPGGGRRPSEGHGEQLSSFTVVIAKRTRGEVAPQSEVLELRTRPRLEIPCQLGDGDIVAVGQAVEQRANARQDAFARTIDVQLAIKMRQVTLVKLADDAVIVLEAVTHRKLDRDPSIGAARHRKRAGWWTVEDVDTGLRHRAPSGAAGPDERAIDVEQY